MIFLIIAWSLLTMILYACGSTFLDLTKSVCFKRFGDRFIVSVWLGVIILSNIILAISIFTPLSLLILIAVCIGLILLSALLSQRNIIAFLKRYLSLGLALGLTALLVSISYVTTQVVTWYDTGIYHMGMIKWLSQCGAVPGLALIFYGLGYTSSWFALTASFNSWVLESRAGTIIGGFVLLMAILHLWICLVRVIKNRSEIEDWFVIISSLLALVVIARFEIYISPSQDLPVIILTVVTAWTIIIISRRRRQLSENEDKPRGHDEVITLILSAGAVSIKLSAIPILLVSGLFYLFTEKICIKKVFSFPAIVLLVLLPFFIVQIITSGSLLYPSSLVGFDLPWSIGEEKIKLVTDQILKAAQWSTFTPGNASYGGWLLQWVKSEKYQAVLILITCFIIFISINKLKKYNLEWVKWVFPMGLIGLLYTMLIGPTWRYNLGYIAIMSSVLLSLHCDNKSVKFKEVLIYLEKKLSNKLMPHILLVIFGLAIIMTNIARNNLTSLNYLNIEIKEALRTGEVTKKDNKISRLFLPPKILKYQLNLKNTEKVSFVVADLELLKEKVNEFYLYKPKKGYQCWDVELPCSPLLTYPEIKLRNNDLGICGGFIRVK